MANIKVELKVIPKTHFHIGTGYGLAGICDSTTVKGSDGFAYIPGTTLKGRIKHYYRIITEALGYSPICVDDSPCPLDVKPCVVCSLFGSRFRPGEVVFSDGTLTNRLKDFLSKENDPVKESFKHIERQVRTNVTINRSRRVAEPQRLFSVETINPELEYEAVIHGDFSPTQNISGIPLEAILLVAAIKSVDAFGGRKSRGLGRCVFIPEKVFIDSAEIEANELLKKLRG